MPTTLISIFSAIGGLGLLLFGLKMVSSGLSIVAGDKLQAALKKATANRFLAVFAGIVATIALNSSTATSLIVIGFVNSKLMTLIQAMGIKMGANIGTTFSSQLLAVTVGGFNINQIAPLFIFIGVVMYLFVKKKNIRNIGYVVLGFGVLLFSIRTMGEPLRAFAREPAFEAMLYAFENPFLALLVGLVLTATIQSSSATIGVLIAMLVVGEVDISFQTSVFIILGSNIGTNLTAVIASIPLCRDAKRASLFDMSYDVVGSVVIVGPLLLLFPGILNWFQSTWSAPSVQVAMFHSLYNVFMVALLLPNMDWIAKLFQKIIPPKDEESAKVHERELLYLNESIMLSPVLAVTNAHLEIVRMGRIADETLNLSLQAFFERDEKKAERTIANEKTINFLNGSITAKLVEINNKKLSPANAEKIGKMFGIMPDIERIGDHAENIAEYAVVIKDNNLVFSEAAMNELRELSDLTTKVTKMAMETLERQEGTWLPQIEEMEERIDHLCEEYVENNITRLKAGECNPRSAAIFTDMLIDLERSSDHATHLAFAYISLQKVKLKKKKKRKKQKK
jgi:phosphate:Na+ symporter